MKKLLFILPILFLVSCWETTVEIEQEKTKQAEIYKAVELETQNKMIEDMGKYYLWCDNICVAWLNNDSRAICITNCINALKNQEIILD